MKETYEREIVDRKKNIELQKLREESSIRAFKKVANAAWKIRYEQILKYLNSKEYDKILLMVLPVDDYVVNSVLFDTHKTSDEYKAVQIVNYMQKQGKLDDTTTEEETP